MTEKQASQSFRAGKEAFTNCCAESSTTEMGEIQFTGLGFVQQEAIFTDSYTSYIGLWWDIIAKHVV